MTVQSESIIILSLVVASSLVSIYVAGNLSRWKAIFCQEETENLLSSAPFRIVFLD